MDARLSWIRQHEDSSDQHLKQEIRSCVEDIHTQSGRSPDTKKREEKQVKVVVLYSSEMFRVNQNRAPENRVSG